MKKLWNYFCDAYEIGIGAGFLALGTFGLFQNFNRPFVSEEQKLVVLSLDCLAFAWFGAGLAMYRLRTLHTAAFEDMGSPGILDTPFSRDSWKFQLYLIRFGSLELNDSYVSLGFGAFILLLPIAVISMLFVA